MQMIINTRNISFHLFSFVQELKILNLSINLLTAIPKSLVFPKLTHLDVSCNKYFLNFILLFIYSCIY